MLTLTKSGTITRKKGKTITIILKGGRKVTTNVARFQLHVGDKCHVAFNEAHDIVSEVIGYHGKSFTSIDIKNESEKDPSNEEIKSCEKHHLINTIEKEFRSFSETERR